MADAGKLDFDRKRKCKKSWLCQKTPALPEPRKHSVVNQCRKIEIKKIFKMLKKPTSLVEYFGR